MVCQETKAKIGDIMTYIWEQHNIMFPNVFIGIFLVYIGL